MSDYNQTRRPFLLPVSFNDFLEQIARHQVTIDPKREYKYHDPDGRTVSYRGSFLIEAARMFYTLPDHVEPRHPVRDWFVGMLESAGSGYGGWFGFAMTIPAPPRGSLV